MMREIKFRAWSTTRNKMVSASEVTTVFWPTLRFCEYNDMDAQVDLPLMQYTGLLDKNGAEIYDGDVMSIKYKWKGETHVCNAQIQFDKVGFILLENPEDGNWCDDWNLGDDSDKFEIIGNIHQNPELLKDKS